MPVSWTVAVACLTFARLGAADFQPPDPPQTTVPLGTHLQRALTLLATSTPTRHHRVRVLYYGQSITAQQWTGQVTADLKARFPHADIQAENRAIGGFTAPSLLRTAEYDLYNYYPDLLIFHVYDGHKTGELEQIIARVRQRTTADILIRTAHFRWDQSVPREGSVDDPKHKGAQDNDSAQAVKIRELAAKYDLALADTRVEWQRYLTRYDLKPKDLLGDGIHLNPLGNKLMAALVIPHLRYLPDAPTAPWRDRVRDVPVADPAVTRGADGSFELRFSGNRVDVLAGPAAGARLGSAKVLIDGRDPATFQELYAVTRPSVSYKMWWPAAHVVEHTQPRVAEKWTLKVTKVDAAAGNFWYTVAGSVTGPDGEGERKKPFTSNSGRVAIAPKDWWMETTQRYAGNAVVPEGFEVKWEVKPNWAAPYQALAGDDPTRAVATMLVQMLSNGPHTLRLVPNGDGAVPVTGFRVYTPPLAPDRA